MCHESTASTNTFGSVAVLLNAAHRKEICICVCTETGREPSRAGLTPAMLSGRSIRSGMKEDRYALSSNLGARSPVGSRGTDQAQAHLHPPTETEGLVTATR